MGAVKSIPVVSEVVTAGESLGKLIGAAGASIAGDEEAAKELLKGAGDAWTDYAERQPIAAGINMAVREIQGDEEGARKVGEKMVQSIEDLADSTPVVGHVKGVVHYATGDTEHGDKCMKGASKSLVVAGVTAATAGAGAIVAGSIAVGSSAGMDGVISGIDSAVHNEFRPHGQIAAIDWAIKTKDPNDIANAVLAPVAEFGMASIGKSARIRKNAKIDHFSAAKSSNTSSVPPGNVQEVCEVIVWISNDQHITCIQFLLQNGEEFMCGSNAEGDVTATQKLCAGERITSLELVKKEKKLVGLALHIEKRAKPITFGTAEREDCEVKTFNIPSGLHIIGLKEVDGKEVVEYSESQNES